MNNDFVLKLFDSPDEVKRFDKGKFELVFMPHMTIGRATYQPGWRWSTHVGVGVRKFCSVEHMGVVISGASKLGFEDGTEYDLIAGTVFYIPSKPHDGWVVGDEDYVSLHFLGADEYHSQLRQAP